MAAGVTRSRVRMERGQGTAVRGRIGERVVTVGGGTGSYTMLSELKKVADRLWAVVAASRAVPC